MAVEPRRQGDRGIHDGFFAAAAMITQQPVKDQQSTLVFNSQRLNGVVAPCFFDERGGRENLLDVRLRQLLDAQQMFHDPVSE